MPDATLPSPAPHLDWVDFAKAFGMILVILGHSGGLPWYLYRVIYAFHMPLFFFLSGVLIRDEFLVAGFKPYFLRAAKSIFPAYFFFGLIGYVFWFAVLRQLGVHGENLVPWYKPMLAIPYGSAAKEATGLQPSVLWFFTCLFSAQVLLYFLLRLPKTALQCAGAVILATIGVLLRGPALPFQLEVAFVAVGFLFLGRVFRKYQGAVALARPSLTVAAGAGALGILCALLNHSIDMRTSAYGNPALFYVAALCLTGSVVLFAKRLPARIPLAARIAASTILIFPLHSMVFTLIKGVAISLLHLPPALKSSFPFALIASALNLTFLLLIAPGFRRAFPWVFGLKPGRPAKA